jgi:catechol 2,3-dioxygenase-like lactoylglutathione lyase family enzyme
MDHFTIVTDRLDETRGFYAALGLHDGPRPDFGFGGAWLYIGERPVLHVVETGRMPEPRRGVLDHMAFSGEGLQAIAQQLRQSGVSYKIIRTPKPFTRWQMFFNDPNGVEVEIDFDYSEMPPEDWKTTR